MLEEFFASFREASLKIVVPSTFCISLYKYLETTGLLAVVKCVKLDKPLYNLFLW